MTKKLAIVTGGTRGIGKEISVKLLADGFEVVAVYRSDDQAAKLFKSETGVHTVKLDVTDLSACIDSVEKLQKKYGACGVLVNNAGITRDGMLHKMDASDWGGMLLRRI